MLPDSGGTGGCSDESRGQAGSNIAFSNIKQTLRRVCKKDPGLYLSTVFLGGAGALPTRAYYLCFLFRDNCSYFKYRKRQFNVLPKF